MIQLSSVLNFRQLVLADECRPTVSHATRLLMRPSSRWLGKRQKKNRPILSGFPLNQSAGEDEAAEIPTR
jgi:hypothetical protein